jgi:serine/threonine protein kinase
VPGSRFACPQCGFLLEGSAEDALCPRCLLLANFETRQLSAPARTDGRARFERIGLTLDHKYHVERLLGHGGMGSVYLATHLGTSRPVALKLIAEPLAGRPDFELRFRREAQALGQLRHPNVVNVIDYDVTSLDAGNVAFLAMEYLDGCNLAAFLEKHRSLPVALILDTIDQVASALDAAHALGIVHRDLKPENIWLEPDRLGGHIARVLDFGLAKMLTQDVGQATTSPGPGQWMPEAADETATQAVGALTQAGSVLGTPAYMSPEQCRGEPLDGRADVYSLAVIAYSTLAGRLPFEGSSAELIRQHIGEPPPPLRKQYPGVSQAVSDAVRSGLEKKPEDRPQTAGAFAARLRASVEIERVLLRRGRAASSLLPLMTAALLLQFCFGGTLFTALLLGVSQGASLRGGWLELASYGMAFSTLLLLGNWEMAGWSSAFVQIRENRQFRASFRRALADYVGIWPGLISTQLAAVLSLRPYRHSLWPVVCVLEGRRGRDALRRSAELTRFVRGAASSLALRQMAFAVLGTACLCLPALREGGLNRLAIGAQILPLFFVIAGMSVGVSAAFPLLYFRARQTLGEGDAPGFSTGETLEFPGNRIPGLSRATLAWIVVLILGIGTSAYLRQAGKGKGRPDALVSAAEMGRVAEVRRLLSSGADLRSKKGAFTALTRAALFGQRHVVAVLLEAGANVNENDGSVGTPLYLAVTANHDALAQMLLERGADPNLAPSWGQTPLMVAAGQGDLPMVELLLRYHADPARRSQDGWTAAAYARREGHGALGAVLKRSEVAR